MRLEGISLTFENDKVGVVRTRSECHKHTRHSVVFKELIVLQKIRKCTTQKGDIFVLEEFGRSRVDALLRSSTLLRLLSDPDTKQIVVRKFKSSMVSGHGSLIMILLLLLTVVFYVL